MILDQTRIALLQSVPSVEGISENLHNLVGALIEKKETKKKRNAQAKATLHPAQENPPEDSKQKKNSG